LGRTDPQGGEPEEFWRAWRKKRPYVERAPRGVVVGRKNHYGSRSERGTRVAALFYSLIESAKLCGVEPRAYLGEATRRTIRNPGTVTLPRDLK
jgi:transposase